MYTKMVGGSRLGAGPHSQREGKEKEKALSSDWLCTTTTVRAPYILPLPPQELDHHNPFGHGCPPYQDNCTPRGACVLNVHYMDAESSTTCVVQLASSVPYLSMAESGTTHAEQR
jgi:hypothetical protein